MLEFTTIKNPSGRGIRFDWANPPAPGTAYIDNFGDRVRFDEISFAGMLACTRESDGVQSLYFPQHLTELDSAINSQRKEGGEG